MDVDDELLAAAVEIVGAASRLTAQRFLEACRSRPRRTAAR
jgi:hypothetical protein